MSTAIISILREGDITAMKKNSSSAPVFDSSKMLLSESSSFAMQEAYKTMRANIIFSLPGKGCKCIGVISANRGEGKSSIATNLSLSLAQLNKRIVLIDCDMRLPTIASKLGIRSVPGLSNYLSGEYENIPIVHIEDKGIDVIPSGNIPPDTTALIDSDEMKRLVAQLKDNYDFIVFDFPPVNVVSDAVMMADTVDGYLIVIRHNYSENKKIDEMMQQLRLSKARVIGAAYNCKGSQKKNYKKDKSYYKNNYYYKDNRSGKESNNRKEE